MEKLNRVRGNGKLIFNAHQKEYINPNAQQWIQTLYDEDFLQYTGGLNLGHAYCCLGVGSLLCQAATGIEVDYDGSYLNAPSKNWLGLADSAGHIKSDYQKVFAGKYKETSLSNLNDTGKSFKEIAEILLEHYAAFFKPIHLQNYKEVV